MVHILCDGLILNKIDSALFTYAWPFVPAIIGGVIAGVAVRWLVIRLFEKKEYDDMNLMKITGRADIRIERDESLSMLYGGQVIKNVKKKP